MSSGASVRCRACGRPLKGKWTAGPKLVYVCKSPLCKLYMKGQRPR